jgi:hypothetical protein
MREWRQNDRVRISAKRLALMPAEWGLATADEFRVVDLRNETDRLVVLERASGLRITVPRDWLVRAEPTP